MNELVSAIITSYKRRPEIVAKAIDSVLNQSYDPIEIIVIDDNENGSYDSISLREYLAKNYPDIIYIKQDGNKGACEARNLGLKYSNGEFIGYLDDDDEWLPDKIYLQVNAFQKGAEDIALVYGEGYLVDYHTDPPTRTVYNLKSVESDLQFKDLLFKDKIGSTSMPLIRKAALVYIGGFCTFLPARQDYELWLRLLKKYKITGIQDKLFIHNVYEGEQISASPGKAFIGYKYIYKEFKSEYDSNIVLKLSIYSQMYHTAKKAKSKETILIGIKYGVAKVYYYFYKIYKNKKD